MVDGLNAFINFPISSCLSVIGNWTLSNQRGTFFEFTSCLKAKKNENQSLADGVHELTFRCSEEEMQATMNLNIPQYSLSICTQTTIPRKGKVINVAQVSKDLTDDSHVKIILQKVNSRTVSVTTTYMQSILKNLQAGFQMHYLALLGQCSFSYCAMCVVPCSKFGQHQFFISYEPLQAKSLHLAYIAKVS